MEPRIQYVKTSDGVSIAYATAGEGTPLIVAPSPPLSHVQLQWQMFGYLMEPVARTFRLTWYDSRGSGLSDRRAIDFSMAAMVRDLEAVADRVSPEKFALLAIYDAVPISVTYAAANPGRLSHLILVDGWAKFSEDYDKVAIHADEALRDGDWTLYTETLAKVLIGFDDLAFAAKYAEFIRTCVDPDACREAFSVHGNEGYDVTKLLSAVSTPTLVAHNQNNAWVSVRAGQRLAARIPDAQFVVLNDIAYQSLPGLIAEVTGQDPSLEQSSARSNSTTAAPSGTAIILFADMACRCPHYLAGPLRPVTEPRERHRTSRQPCRRLSRSRGFGQPADRSGVSSPPRQRVLSIRSRRPRCRSEPRHGKLSGLGGSVPYC